MQRFDPTIRSLAARFPSGYSTEEHAHDWDQLVYASRGALLVQANRKQWILPPQRCLHLSAGIRHRVQALTDVSLKTVYVRTDRVIGTDLPVKVVHVSPLLREIFLEIARVGALDDGRPNHAALATLLASEIGVGSEVGLTLPLPIDPRAREVADRVCQSFLGHVARERTIDALVKGTGLSARTAERLFRNETGMSFGRWVQQAALQHAVRRLSEGLPVATIARECGYESVSAFVTMFKKSLGVTPGRYCPTRNQD